MSTPYPAPTRGGDFSRAGEPRDRSIAAIVEIQDIAVVDDAVASLAGLDDHEP